MSKKPPAISAVIVEGQVQKIAKEKPFATRMKRQLIGKPLEDVILDPDNPNLIMERLRDS